MFKMMMARNFLDVLLSPHSHYKPPVDFDATKYRRWVSVVPQDESKPRMVDVAADACKTSATKFSIMTYNLLSQHYMWKKVFGYLNQNYLDWSGYRFPLINKTLEQFHCDIMCFQEMEARVYDEYWSLAFPEYSTMFIKKPSPNYWGHQPEECMDGVGVFIRKERFEVLACKKLHYGEYITENPDKFELTQDMKERVIPRNTVALLVKLLDKKTGSKVYVTNTHLYWSPQFNDVKVIQTKVLLGVLEEFIDIEDRCNPVVVMCGDFNSTPHSDVFHLLEEGQVDTETSPEFTNKYYGEILNAEKLEKGKILNPFLLATAYKKLLRTDGHGLEFTSYTRSLTAVLDHIWYSNDIFQVKRILGEVDQEYCNRTDVKGFPNRQFPSDHIPLVAELEYK